MFAEVAGQILRVDIGMIKRGDEEDPKLFIKSLPPVAAPSGGAGPSKPPTSGLNPALGTEPSVLTPDQKQQEEHEDLSKSVITDLLNFLVIDSCPVPPVQRKFSFLFFKFSLSRRENWTCVDCRITLTLFTARWRYCLSDFFPLIFRLT